MGSAGFPVLPLSSRYKPSCYSVRAPKSQSAGRLRRPKRILLGRRSACPFFHFAHSTPSGQAKEDRQRVTAQSRQRGWCKAGEVRAESGIGEDTRQHRSDNSYRRFLAVEEIADPVAERSVDRSERLRS